MSAPHQLSQEIALHALRVLVDDFGMKKAAISRSMGMSRTFIDKIYQGHSTPTKNFSRNMTSFLGMLEQELENCKHLNYEYESRKQPEKDTRKSRVHKRTSHKKESSVWG